MFGDFDWPRRQLFRGSLPDLQIDVDRAVAELAFLYSPDFLRGASFDQRRRPFPLFISGYIFHTATLLLLGADLAQCEGWREDTKLLADLRSFDDWDAARLEVGLWAGLRRVGCQVLHEPRKTEADPRTDLVVTDGDLHLAIEAKSVGIPDTDRNRNALEEFLMHGIDLDPRQKWAHSIVITASEELHRLVDQTPSDRFMEEVGPRLQATMQTWWAKNGYGGLYGPREPIPDIGECRIDPHENPNTWGVHVVGLPARSEVPALVRALRAVRRGTHQVSAHQVDLRVVVAQVSHMRLPVESAASLVEPFVAKEPDLYRAHDYIVFLNSHRNDGPWKTEVGFVRMPWATARPAPGTAWTWPAGLEGWRLSV